MRKLAFLALAVLGLSQVVGCIFVSDDDDGGYFRYAWVVNAGPVSPGTLSDCATQGVTAVELRAIDSLSTEWRDVYNCTDYAGTSGVLPLDNYVVAAQATNCPLSEPAGGPCFDVGSPNVLSAWVDVDASLVYAGDTVDVGPWIFWFQTSPPTSGNVTFDIDYGTTNTNCGDTASGGAAVSNFYLDISDGGACIGGLAVQVDGADTGCGGAGDQPCDTCGSPTEIMCTEKGIPVTILDVPNGTYTISIFGNNFTGTGCYNGSANVTVDGANVSGITIDAVFNGDSGACSYKRAP